MSASLLPWLDDATLAQLAVGVVDRSMWTQRYDPQCPSEFYRGYATLLMRIADALRSNVSLPVLLRVIDAFDPAIQSLAANECRNGASFALMNVASYARVGTVQQIWQTLNAELACISRCFVQNRTKGL